MAQPADFAFFAPDGDLLVPQEVALSLWRADQLHGVAVSAALARQAERCLAELGRQDLQPARFTVDLFRPAMKVPTAATATVVRQSGRLCLLDVVLSQDDEPVARASAMFLRPTADPEGRSWVPTTSPEPPPVEVAPVGDRPHIPFLRSGDGEWSQDFSAHQNAERKQTWQTAVPTVAGERPSRFAAVAGIADATSMVTNWGTNGVEFINSDITLTLGRLPEGVQVGLAAVDRVVRDGIAIGTATVFDRAGSIGTAVITSIANQRRTVDFENVELSEDGRRSTSRV